MRVAPIYAAKPLSSRVWELNREPGMIHAYIHILVLTQAARRLLDELRAAVHRAQG